eukprot:842058_1
MNRMIWIALFVYYVCPGILTQNLLDDEIACKVKLSICIDGSMDVCDMEETWCWKWEYQKQFVYALLDAIASQNASIDLTLFAMQTVTNNVYSPGENIDLKSIKDFIDEKVTVWGGGGLRNIY